MPRLSRLIAFGAATLALASPAFAATSYVHAGRLVDTEKGIVLADQLIKVVDGRVAAVSPWTRAPTDGPA
jgi:hypothetical protein